MDDNKLTEADRRNIAAATQEMVNTGVLRQLARLVRQWKEEEALLRRAAMVVLGILAIAVVISALWFYSLVLPR